MMKKKVFYILIVFIWTCQTTFIYANDGNTRLEPYLAILLDQLRRDPEAISNKLTLKKLANKTYIHVFISGNFAESDLSALDGKVLDRFGAVVLASVPVAELEQIGQIKGVEYVEAPKRHRLSTDVSIPEIGITRLRTTRSLTGKDVIIGIMDTGIDWQHHDFRKPDGSTRIKYLLDLSEQNHENGREYTEADLNRALTGTGLVNQKDLIGHGTHVAGIAAGDGSHDAQFGTYVGAAPEADLIVVKTTREAEGTTISEDDQLIAMRYIDEKAARLGKPYVVNLSLGGQYGPHDGSTAYERALTSFVGPGRPGKVLVAAAGNEGDEKIHASGTLSATSKRAAIVFEIDPYVPQPGTRNDELWMDIWYDGSNDMSALVKTPDGNAYGPVTTFDTRSWNTLTGTITIKKANVDANNGDKEIIVLINDDQSNTPKPGQWQIELTGTSGRFDAWLAQSSMEASIISPLDNSMKVTVPGTAEAIITVGAYHTKNIWQDKDNKSWGLKNAPARGDLAAFSNPGPTRDGRIKPDLAAPGSMVASTLSGDAPPTHPNSIFYVSPSSQLSPYLYIVAGEEHAVSQGTSMAAPHVTGIVALLLQENPNLTADQVMEKLIKSARSDGFTASVPNNLWGYGKTDAVRAEQIIPGEEIPMAFTIDDGFPNPANSRIEFRYSLPANGSPIPVRATIFNILGQQIRILRADVENAGAGKVFWDGTDDMGRRMGTGVYFLEFKAGAQKAIKKILLLMPGK